MEFKNALSILFSNMGQTLKIVVWMLISIIITFGFACAIFIPLWNVFSATTDMLTYVDAIKASINGFFAGEITVMNTLYGVIGGITSALKAVSTNAGATVGLVFGILAIYAEYCFVFGMSFYPVADIINKKMGSNLSFGFASNMIMNLKNAVRYSAARLCITFPIDIVIYSIVFAIVLGLFKYIKFATLTLVLLFFLLAATCRAMLLAGWLPRMLYFPEERVFINFARSLTSVKYNARGLFKAYILTFSVSYMLIVVFGVPTGGLFGIIIPSLYYYLLRAVELVSYYKMNGMSFYIDSNVVVETVEYGYRKDNQNMFDED